MPIHAELLRHAKDRPDKPALVIDGSTLSYGALYLHARAICRFLHELPRSGNRAHHLPGVGKLVALSLGNHIGFAEYFTAATALPNACAVIDPMMPPERIERIIERLAPDILVVDDDAAPGAEIARRLDIPVVVAGAEPFDLSAAAADLPCDAEGIFLIGFTSGTTAEPKAYFRSREQWRRSLDRGRSSSNSQTGPRPSAPALSRMDWRFTPWSRRSMPEEPFIRCGNGTRLLSRAFSPSKRSNGWLPSRPISPASRGPLPANRL